MKKKRLLPAFHVVSANSLSHCRLSIGATAAALLIGFAATSAHALSMERLTVQSALGEPLRAEIEITDVSAAEVEDLRVQIASHEAFNAAGVPYSPTLADIRISLQRRPNGSYVVRLTGNQALNEPFVDLLLEASWSAGRIVRSYTVLLDPPVARQAAAPAPSVTTAPQLSAPEPTPAPAPTTQAPASTPVAQAPVSAPAAQAPAPAPAAQNTGRSMPPPPVKPSTAKTHQPRTKVATPSKPAPAPAPAPSAASDEPPARVSVKPGDTAGRIAHTYKPEEVSLDQMLVAMLNANPSAFIRGNMNRLRAGTVIDIPDAEQAGAVPHSEARRTVVAQARNFNEYRRKLAENVPATHTENVDRRTSGKLQANIQDRNAASASPDKLTVSAAGAGNAADDKIVQNRQAQEEQARVAELSKNLSELHKLKAQGAAAADTAAPAAAAPAAAPAEAPSIVPAVTAPLAAAPAMTDAAPSGTPTPQKEKAPSSEDAKTLDAARSHLPDTPKEQASYSFLRNILGDPVLLAAASSIIILVLMLLAYRVSNRRKAAVDDSEPAENNVPKEPFFSAGNDAPADAKNRDTPAQSPLPYPAGQLDVSDIDPIAEAEVYLTYGRDLQAEEILREALRANPERTAIYVKLLEIYLKRHDLPAYETLARDVHKLTGGTGNDWAHVVELGHKLDPTNPLYQSNATATAPATPAAATALASPATATAEKTAAPAVDTPASEKAVPFAPSIIPPDLDLELPSSPKPLPAGASTDEKTVLQKSPSDDSSQPKTTGKPAAPDKAPTLAVQPKKAQSNPGTIEFDMNTSAKAAPTGPATGELNDEDPYLVKLNLARELRTLNDTEGARALIEEVIAGGTGELRSQAQKLLAELR